MIKKAIYPGTFDPITFGHIDLIKRALKIFDEVIVAVAKRPSKEAIFSIEERVNMVRLAAVGLKGIKVEPFDGLTVKYAKRKNIHVLIRGIRMMSDFEYEFQMALTNRKLDKTIETIYMMPSEEYSYISSRMIKEIVGLGADAKNFIPKFVAHSIRKKLKI